MQQAEREREHKRKKYVRYLERAVERVNGPLHWNVVEANKVTVDLSKVSCQTDKSLKHDGGNEDVFPHGVYNLNLRSVISYTPLMMLKSTKALHHILLLYITSLFHFSKSGHKNTKMCNILNSSIPIPQLNMTALVHLSCGYEGVCVSFTDIPVCTGGIETASDSVSNSAGPNLLL